MFPVILISCVCPQYFVGEVVGGEAVAVFSAVSRCYQLVAVETVVCVGSLHP